MTNLVTLISLAVKYHKQIAEGAHVLDGEKHNPEVQQAVIGLAPLVKELLVDAPPLAHADLTPAQAHMVQVSHVLVKLGAPALKPEERLAFDRASGSGM